MSGDMDMVGQNGVVSRLTRWWPVRLVFYIGALLIVVLLVKALSMPLIPASSSLLHEPLVTVRNIIQTIVIIAVYGMLVRRLEQRTATEIKSRRAVTLFVSGAGIGMTLIGLVYLILLALGIAQFRAGTGLTGLMVGVLKPAVIGILEELVFRAILFRIVQQIAGTAVAVLVSAGLFGLAHAANPGATPLALGFLTVELGIFLALVYALTNSLWLVAGIHMGWNFAQGYVFGSDVSGTETSNAVMRTSLKGPDWLAGGAFGVEGSVVTLVISIVSIAIVLALLKRRNLWLARKFELRAAVSPTP